MIPGMEAKLGRDRLLLFWALSLLLHFFIALTFYQTRMQREFKIPENTVFVDLDRTPPQLTPQEKERQRQIVESESVASPSKPKDADYLGERDQSVEEQTRARQVDIFRKGGAASKAGSQGRQRMALKDLAPPGSKMVKAPTQAEIDGMRERQKQQTALADRSAEGEQSAENPGSASNDYLKNVKDGDRTLLNTKEFVYFSYYRRIRERLEVAWNSKLRSTRKRRKSVFKETK